MKYLISFGGTIKKGSSYIEDTFTKVLRTKKRGFHSIAVIEMEELTPEMELTWFCNSRPQTKKIEMQEPQRGCSPFYPKSTLLWGDYNRGNNPYLIAIPIDNEFSWDDAMKCINSGLDAFLRSSSQPKWSWKEERNYMLSKGRWSLASDITLGLQILGKEKEAKEATAGKGGQAYNDAFAPYKEQAIAALKKALQ